MIAHGDNMCDDVDYLQVAVMLVDDPDIHIRVFDEEDRGVPSLPHPLSLIMAAMVYVRSPPLVVCYVPSIIISSDFFLIK